MFRFSDARNFGKSLAGIGLIVGPLLFVISILIGPAGSEEIGEYLQNVADAEGRAIAGMLLFLVGSLLLVPGVLGIIRLGRDRGVTFVQVAASLVLIGVLTTLMFYPIGVIDLVMADQADRAQMVALSEDLEEHGLAYVVFGMFLLGLVLGNILLGIAVWRRGIAPIWAGAALVLAPVVAFVSEESRILGAVAFALLLVGYGYLGLKLLGMSEEEWDARPGGAAAGPGPGGPGGPTV